MYRVPCFVMRRSDWVSAHLKVEVVRMKTEVIRQILVSPANFKKHLSLFSSSQRPGVNLFVVIFEVINHLTGQDGSPRRRPYLHL